MVRTQIQLTREQHKALKSWARERGISLAEAVRRCVAERMSRDNPAATSRADRVREALTVVGKYTDASGATTIARDHDDHLADAYGS
ncbi:MAG: CopG family transcriptional regulator [Gemmatimonadales bacterium]